MAISHINTTTNTQANATTATASKPGGTTTGDLLLATFTCNSQNATPPSGWTEIVDETIEVFRAQIFYKVATASEPASYAFSVGAAAPLVLSIMCLRGIDSADPIDIDPVVESGLTHSEPYTTPTVTGGSAGRLVYLRTTRLAGSTPMTFTAAAGATERADVGVFSGGSVCYSQGLYLSNADYSTSGSQSGLAITASSGESHNIVTTLGIKSSGVPGTMTVNLPVIPDANITLDGSVAYPAVVDVDLPLPTMDVQIFNGEFEGVVDVLVPIEMTGEGYTDVRGELEVALGIGFTSLAETRRFAENVVVPVRDERWFIITQDGYRLGVRNVTQFPLRVELPMLEVGIGAYSAAPGDQVQVASEAFDPTITTPGGAGPVTAIGETYDVMTVFGELIDAEAASSNSAEAFDAIVSMGVEAGETVASVEGYAAILGTGYAENETAAFNALVNVGPTPDSADAEVETAQPASQASQTGLVSATAAASNASTRISFSADLVEANCHQ